MANQQKVQRKPEKEPGKGKSPNGILVFTGLSFKMALTIYLGVVGGQYLDEHLENEIPWFTLLGALIGVAASIYYVFQDLKKL